MANFVERGTLTHHLTLDIPSEGRRVVLETVRGRYGQHLVEALGHRSPRAPVPPHRR